MGGKKKKPKLKSEKILSINFLTLRIGKRWPLKKNASMGFVLNLFYSWGIVIWLKNTDYFLIFFFSFHEEVAPI